MQTHSYKALLYLRTIIVQKLIYMGLKLKFVIVKISNNKYPGLLSPNHELENK